MKPYEHIFFDLDGTLWDLLTNSRKALGEMFGRYPGLEDRAADFETFYTHYYRHNHRLWALLREQRISKEELRVLRFRLAFGDMAIDCAPWVESFADEFMELCPRQGCLVNGAAALLKKLSTRYPLHIISNGFPEVQYIKMETSGILGYFGEVILSEQCGVAKPHPDIFRQAMAATGARAETSLMIGDDWEADILGALGAGIDQAFLTSTEKQVDPAFDRHQLQPPTYVLESLGELHGML